MYLHYRGLGDFSEVAITPRAVADLTRGYGDDPSINNLLGDDLINSSPGHYVPLINSTIHSAGHQFVVSLSPHHGADFPIVPFEGVDNLE